MTIFVFGGVAIFLAIPFVLIIRDRVLAFIVSQGAPPEAIWGIIALQALAALAAALGFYFFRHLYRIVQTVAEGDPFVPINARRLATMGWLAVGGHVLAVPINLIGSWLETISSRFYSDFGLSAAGILLALVLFVLARVFREGTRMREELEGTV